MILRFFSILCLLFLVSSCGQVDFIYNNSIDGGTNPLKNKTIVQHSGLDIPILNKYISQYFGVSQQPKYKIYIASSEEKTKSSVETNQTISTLRYDLNFTYQLESISKNCLIFEKEIQSNFSVTPKSAGFNFGSDKSLESKYELAVDENFKELISYILNVDLNNCKNEN